MESRMESLLPSANAVIWNVEGSFREQFSVNSTVIDAAEAMGSTTPTLNASMLYHEREQGICGVVTGRKVTIAEMVACFIAVLTAIENAVVLIVITCGHHSLRKPPYWFIASLSLADLFTGFEVVLALFVPIGSSPLSRIALKGAAVVTFIASINSLLLVSMDRYIRIVWHVKYERILSRKRIIASIIISWVISIGVFLALPLLGWSCGSMHCCAHDGLCSCLRSKHGDGVCGRNCSQSFVPFTKIYILAGVIYFVLAIVLMTTFYGVIFRFVKAKTFNSGDSKSQSSKGRDVRLAKTLVITLGIFVVCWLPVVGLFIADLIITEHNEYLSQAFDFALVPSIINSFMNPIIYSIRLPHMRTEIIRIFLPCIYRERANSWMSSTSAAERRISLRRQNDQKKLKTTSTSSASKRPSPPQPAREKLLSDNCSMADNTPGGSQA